MTQPNTIPKHFKVKLKTELPYWLVILPGIFLFGVMTKPGFISTWPLMLILTVVLVTYSVLMYRLNQIDIDALNGEVVLTETNLLKCKRVKNYKLKNLQYTYIKGKISLYSRVLNICTLYLNNKEIATITPDRDGWTDDTVNDLAKCLVGLGVPRKFIGYGVKHAEINGL